MNDDKLKKYRAKRVSAATPEPMGSRHDEASVTRSGAFVVHLHDATRSHYDLRIEVGGVLTSFAIPKGPPSDPEEKVLAIHTEDHPIEYLEFEAVIPQGQYGAGPMIAWDRGGIRYLETTAEEGLELGKIDFILSGFKLKGRFALVKLKKGESGKEWLLIKKKDGHSSTEIDLRKTRTRSIYSGLTISELEDATAIAARAEAKALTLGATPGAVNIAKLEPMLCLSAEESDIPRTDYIFELKLDGVRIVAQKKNDQASLLYRSHRDASDAYPEVARAVRALCPAHVVLDGEIVAFDDDGLPNFQRLSQRIGLRGVNIPVVYLVFDLLALGKLDLRNLPLLARRALLREILPGGGYVMPLDFIAGAGEARIRSENQPLPSGAENAGRALFDFCRARKLEGIIAKRALSPYRASKQRTRDWIKIKCERDESFVVIGYTRGNEGRSRLGALELASYQNGKLVACGKAGSGLDEKTIDALLPILEALKTNTKWYEGDPGDAPLGRTMVKPEVVVRVRFLGWSDEGLLRFPVFRGIDHDRGPNDCTVYAHQDELAPPPEEEAPASRVPVSRRVNLTNQTKIFWPKEGYTKGDLCRYYDRVAPTILPYLRDRPIVIVRYPDGIAGKSFFQWNVPFGFPKWMRHVALASSESLKSGDEDSEKKRVFLIDDVAGLLTIANLGAIPIHILACREPSLSECDFCTIDFDVERSTLANGVVLALELRTLLNELGLDGFAKTSGQTGLHVIVPLGQGVKFETAQALNVLLGRLVTAKHPDIATMETSIAKRGARVFVDIGQTGRKRTIVAPYSVRATDGARVSTPLFWNEVTEHLDLAAFTMRTVPDRITRVGDPMRPLLDANPDVPRAIRLLGIKISS